MKQRSKRFVCFTTSVSLVKLLLFVENMILYINIINATNSIFDGFRITVHGWCQN